MWEHIFRFIDNRSLAAKAGIAVSIPLLSLLASLVLFGYYETESRRASLLVHHTMQVQMQLEQVLQLLLDSETGARGYRITGRKRFLQPYELAGLQVPAALRQLDELVADHPNRVAATQRLRELVMDKIKVQKSIVEYPTDNGQQPSLEMFENSKAQMDAVRKGIGENIAEESAILSEREAITTKLHHRTNLILVGMAILAVLGGILATVLIATGIVRRIDRLEANAHRLVNGETLLKNPVGTDEIGRLARTMEETSTILRERESALNEAYNREQHLRLELDQRLQETVSANKELEAFSYSVSHDLRAPLRHIAGFSQLLLENGKEFDEKNKRYLNIIISSIRQMGSLIDDLLEFSRMGRAGMKSEKVDMNEMIVSLMDELSSEITGRNIRWEIDPLPAVKGDPAMIRLVLQNLMSNALKYTRGRDTTEIKITNVPGGPASEANICVADNGVGFDMAFVGKLFGVFQRLHRADEFEGTGIGLANVRRIVGRHGGKVSARGTPGEGAEFCFSLPVYSERGK